ncbi:MAG: WYL domain-containing transcriptional regulator [Planctomycetota bacterium]
MKIGRIGRVVKLLTALQSGRSYSVEDLTKVLGSSRRTVFRDLKELDAIGVPYRYNVANKGYTIEEGFFLPPIDFTMPEALSLSFLLHKMRTHLPMPFKNSALVAALKIENQMPAKLRQYCRLALDNISISTDIHAPTDSLDKYFSELQKASVKKTKVALYYHSLYEGGEIYTIVSPYCLRYHYRAWYVLGFSSLHKSIRTFKLNRIIKLRMLSESFLREKKFDVNEYFGRAWRMIPEGRLCNIKVRFLPKVAQNVAEVQWHSTQKTNWSEDRSVTLEFRVDGLNEISWWILGYGDQAQVLAPAALRHQIITRAENIIKLNKEI